MNYAELRQKIIDFAESDEQMFADNIDGFIKNAEQKIYNSVQIAYLRKNVTGFTTAGNKYLSAPNDFLSVYSMAVIDAQGNYDYLLNKDVNFINQAYPSINDSGKPKYYGIFGPRTTNASIPDLTNEISFILGPTPNDRLEIELHYFFYPESIVTAGSTWLSENFDSALFYGAMREASVFQRMEADVIANYEQKYNEAMTLLKQLSDGKQRQDMYRSGQVRYPVG
jgi:hypothetical protein